MNGVLCIYTYTIYHFTYIYTYIYAQVYLGGQCMYSIHVQVPVTGQCAHFCVHVSEWRQCVCTSLGMSVW